jgi:chromosome segregation ATPase
VGIEEVDGQLARARTERQRLAARLEEESAARKLLEAKFAGLLSLTGRLLAELGAARRDLDETTDGEERRRTTELHTQLLQLAVGDDCGDAQRLLRLIDCAS